MIGTRFNTCSYSSSPPCQPDLVHQKTSLAKRSVPANVNTCWIGAFMTPPWLTTWQVTLHDSKCDVEFLDNANNTVSRFSHSLCPLQSLLIIFSGFLFSLFEPDWWSLSMLGELHKSRSPSSQSPAHSQPGCSSLYSSSMRLF